VHESEDDIEHSSCINFTYCYILELKKIISNDHYSSSISSCSAFKTLSRASSLVPTRTEEESVSTSTSKFVNYLSSLKKEVTYVSAPVPGTVVGAGVVGAVPLPPDPEFKAARMNVVPRFWVPVSRG
jgi:hypothetical protein